VNPGTSSCTDGGFSMAMAGLAIGAAAWTPAAISPSWIKRSRKNEVGRVFMDSRQRETAPDGEPKNFSAGPT